MKRNYITLLFIVISAMATVLVLNYYKIQKPLDVIIESDYRNKGIDISVHYGNYILPSTLVINVHQISGEKTPGDVFRVMLQLAEKLSDKDFEYIELSSKGVLKFTLKGEYFKLLGVQYNNQNPVYTIRTFHNSIISSTFLI